MKKTRKRRWPLKAAAAGLVLAMGIGMVLPVSASDAPTKTYTRKWNADESMSLQLSREMYEEAGQITAESLGGV